MKIDVSSLFCYKLFFLVKSNEYLIDEKMKSFDLSRTQWKTLIRFNFLPNPCTQQQLLQAMEIDRAHLTRVLEQLENRELLTRARVPNNKRSFNITLTSQGKKLLKKIEQIMKNDSDELVKELNKTEKQLFDSFLNIVTVGLLRKLNV